MNKKKILIITRAFYPQNSPRSHRATELVREFSKQGHEVTVITKRNKEFHDQFEADFKIKIIDIGNIWFEILDINKHDNIFKRIFTRISDYFFHFPNIIWMFKTKSILKKIKEQYDLLITVAVPHPIHWGAGLAGIKKNSIAKVWAADCGDPFMLDSSDSFRKIFYFKYFEKLWCRACDAIVVPFEGARNGYYEEFRDKIKVIPQGFSFPPLHRKLKSVNTRPTFVYSGNIGSYRHYYEPFFRLLNNLEKDFNFVVFTKEAEIYKNGLSSISENLEINEYVSRDALINRLEQADFLIHFPYRNQIQKSLKLIDYNYVERPILSYQGAEDNDKVIAFLNGNYEGRMPEENIDQFRIENVAKEFLKLLA